MKRNFICSTVPEVDMRPETATITWLTRGKGFLNLATEGNFKLRPKTLIVLVAVSTLSIAPMIRTNGFPFR